MRKLSLVIVLFLSACKFSTEKLNSETDKKDAEKVVDSLYTYLQQKKTDDATRLFHPNLLASNDPAKFKQFLEGMEGQLTVLKERKLDHWQTKIVQGLNAASIYNLYYLNTYQGFELKTSIVLTKDENNNIRIIGFQANPDKFL